MRRAVVHGVGHALPERIMTNDDLSKIVDTSDEWISQRTGIRERRSCRDDETCSMLCTQAGREALERAGMDPAELELVIAATVTGDMLFPATSCLVQHNLGAKNAGAFDVGAACAGYIYGLATATAMLETGQVNSALVIGADTLSKYVDWTDRSTCVLFGDAAAATVLRAEEGTDRGVIKTVLLSDGSGAEHIMIELGGTKYPAGHIHSEGKQSHIKMAGSEVYRFAVGAMGDACMRVLNAAGMKPSDIDLFVPHQANLRIIDSAAKKLELPPEKVFINVDKYGNTSGGSIPLALYEAERDGRLKPGMVVMTVGFGAGLVWGANLIRW